MMRIRAYLSSMSLGDLPTARRRLGADVLTTTR